MPHALDFAQLKASIPITQVLGMLDINHLTDRGDTLRGCCPLCKHEDTRAFIVTPAKNTWYCFKEKSGGDIIRLVARARELKDREAAQWIADKGAGKAGENAEQPAKAQATRRNSHDFDPLAYLETLEAEHEALSDLDILPETLIAFKAGYSSKGLNRGRLAVAYHNLSGEIEMFIGIALDGTIPRYLAPRGQELPYFFNMHTVEEGAELRIFGTVLEVMRAVENGATNVICPLRPVDYLALSGLTAFVKTKKLTVEF